MSETFEDYVARILSYSEGKRLAAILKRTPGALARRVEGVSRRRLEKRPARGKWSVREILAHLSETELIWSARLRLILGQSGVPIVGMDQDVWAKRYGRVDARRALDTYTALRRSNLELLAGLSRKDWKRWGRHSQFGRLTVEKIFRMVAGHDINHARQIEAQLPKRKRRRHRSVRSHS
jgi:uncharacterized damage-inducible protein DinB